MLSIEREGDKATRHCQSGIYNRCT